MTIGPRARRSHSFPVRLVQCQLEADHFSGVERALASRGVASERVFPDQPPPELTERTKVVVISDPFASMNALAWRQARRVGAGVVMVMDGVVEYRNTFVNPRTRGVFAAGDPARWSFLRPAPADVVTCSGEVDRRVLAAMGNRAVATGLPRIAGMERVPPLSGPAKVLIATANQPWFTEEERGRVIATLTELRQVIDRQGVAAVWRLRADLDTLLGVASDTRPLRDVMAEVSGVITTPSTLMVEAMRAGRMVGVLHAHATPLWQPASFVWARAEGQGMDLSALEEVSAPARDELLRVDADARVMSMRTPDAETLVRGVLEPDASAWARQSAAWHALDASAVGEPASERLGSLLAEACEQPLVRGGGEFPSPARLPAQRPRGARPCVVSVVVCDDSPVGGVQSWSERLGRAFAEKDRGYDVRTLLVCAKPDAWRTAGTSVRTDWLMDLCVLDPSADHVESVHVVRTAIERLAGDVPAVVIPNYTDIACAAAMQLRARGARTIAVAHTDETYYADLARTYSHWDAGVGVSRTCVEWLRDIERTTRPGRAERPLEHIPCVAPVSQAPRTVPVGGPLRIIYAGRMVQVQKRIHDLLKVVDGLEARAVAYELHMVGDGVDLPGWRAALATRSLHHGSVQVHGRQSPAWVERMLPTMDVSILVSEFEGTSVSMLEAMGAGVVPSVTAVRSGVTDWVQDGVTGIVVPVGDCDAMAERLAQLARDRTRLSTLGRAAWARVKKDASIDVMAEKYRSLFDRARASADPCVAGDLGLRLLERWRWNKDWAEHPGRVNERVREVLAEAGYRRIATDWPEPGCDAVVVRTDARPLTRVQAAQIDLWRACGLGVVVGPHLRNAGPEDAMTPADARACELVRRVALGARAAGCERIAVYGTGKHTRRLASLFDGSLPLVGLIDDAPPAWEYMFGLPIVPFESALSSLRPDAVILSSDAWEARMWERSAPWRAAGVRVIPLYGTYETNVKVNTEAVAA